MLTSIQARSSGSVEVMRSRETGASGAVAAAMSMGCLTCSTRLTRCFGRSRAGFVGKGCIGGMGSQNRTTTLPVLPASQPLALPKLPQRHPKPSTMLSYHIFHPRKSRGERALRAFCRGKDRARPARNTTRSRPTLVNGQGMCSSLACHTPVGPSALRSHPRIRWKREFRPRHSTSSARYVSHREPIPRAQARLRDSPARHLWRC